MSTDVFGDFREWNGVLKQLERSTDNGHFDERHDALARLLKYRFNWRIRAKAVKCISLCLRRKIALCHSSWKSSSTSIQSSICAHSRPTPFAASSVSVRNKAGGTAS